MLRVNEGLPAKPLIKEIPDSTYAPLGTGEGAIAPEDVPYFDDPNAPVFDGQGYEEPLPEAMTAPLPDGGEVTILDGPPPEGAELLGPVPDDLAGQIDQLLDGNN
jgi:hypothetical protein